MCRRSGSGPSCAAGDPDTPSLAFQSEVLPASECKEAIHMPDALLQSPRDEAAIGQHVPAMALDVSTPVQKHNVKAHVPEAPPSTESNVDGVSSLLSSTSGIDTDEEYSRDEKMLNEFTKFHPMTRYP